MLSKHVGKARSLSPFAKKLLQQSKKDSKGIVTNLANNPYFQKKFSSDQSRKFENGELIDSMKHKNTTIYIVKGDLTAEDTDAIVNAANEHLAHGGGVAGAVSRKAGPSLQQGSYDIVKKKGKIPTGSAVEQFAPTTLRCRYVIHAVGPVYSNGQNNEEYLLGSCIEKSLEIADSLTVPVNSISFPAISSGIFGFPKDLCAQVFMTTILSYLNNNEQTNIKHIRLTNFDKPTVDVFYEEFQKWKVTEKSQN